MENFIGGGWQDREHARQPLRHCVNLGLAMAAIELAERRGKQAECRWQYSESKTKNIIDALDRTGTRKSLAFDQGTGGFLPLLPSTSQSK